MRDVLGAKQLCAHPRRMQLEEFMFDLDALVKTVDASLEGLGYNLKYHEQVTKALAKVQDRMRVIGLGEPLVQG